MIRRTALPLAAFLTLAFSASAAPVAGQNVAGRWLLDVTLDAGNGRAAFIFQVEGSKITGTYSGVLGDQDVTGTIEGNAVHFGFDSPDAGGKVNFEGLIDGDSMEGTCEYGGLGSGSFVGSRVP